MEIEFHQLLGPKTRDVMCRLPVHVEKSSMNLLSRHQIEAKQL